MSSGARGCVARGVVKTPGRCCQQLPASHGDGPRRGELRRVPKAKSLCTSVRPYSPAVRSIASRLPALTVGAMCMCTVRAVGTITGSRAVANQSPAGGPRNRTQPPTKAGPSDTPPAPSAAVGRPEVVQAQGPRRCHGTGGTGTMALVAAASPPWHSPPPRGASSAVPDCPLRTASRTERPLADRQTAGHRLVDR